MATSPRGPPRKSPPYGHGVAIAASMTKPGTSHRRQKRMGPAPFASFEDLSDELDSPEDKNATNVVRLPGIREDATPCSPAAKGGEIRAEFIYTGISLIGAPSTPTVSGHTPTMPSAPGIGEKKSSSLTPRIDISRASSSSHHDSKESTPDDEAEKDVVGGGKLAFEEGAVELRSSTEDIDASKKIVRVPQPPPSTSVAPPVPRVHSPHDQQLHDDSYHSHNRKDSQSSEIGLLCISGRTSRLSSIGSQGSAQSRISNASHLSVVSGASRSPSPHKMLLETSFCGTKPKRGDLSIDLFEGKEGEDEGTKELEKVLLQRQHDPTKALIAEGVDLTPQSPRSPIVHEPEVIVRSPVQQPVVETPKALKKPLEKVTIKIDKPPPIIEPSDDVQRPKMPKHIVSDSGTEFIYIPLKGPLPEDPPGFTSTTSKTTNGVQGKTKVRETKSASGTTSMDTKDREKRKSKSASPSPAMTRHYQTSSSGSSLTNQQHGENPKYIRIRLKPEHLYEDYDPNAPKIDTPSDVVQKPETLNLQSKFDEITISPSHYQVQTPKSRHLTKESPRHHKSPSPSLSRKSSFASLFKSRETISPESPTMPGRSKRTKDTHRRSRSKSRERGYPSSTESIDSKGKSMFSLFSRPRKTSSRQSLDRSPGPDLPNLENLAQNIQNTSKSKRSSHYETPLQGESVRIPLHSPTYYESKCFLESFKTSSQDSQETVIEVKTSTKHTEKSKEADEGISSSVTCATMRQSSTSSENIVFSTKLGSTNEIFTTKLPKHQEIIETTTAIVEYVKERVTSEDEAFLNRSKSRSESIVEDSVASKVEYEEPEVIVKEEPTRRLSTSTSNESRKFKLEKSKRADSSEQLTINLTQSTMSTCYIPAEEPVAPPSPIMLPKQDSEDIPIIAKEKEKEKFKLAELRKADEHYSSESERESDFDRREKPQVDEVMQEMEPERKGLVLQQDSFDDDLPYIPTTLPQERSMAVPIIPVKQRANMEVKTCTIERPRSTTPIKPTLEVYRDPDKQTKITKADKLKISLPKQDEQQPKVKSPRRRISGDEAFSAPVGESADWFDFTKARTSLSYKDEDTPPPLPPKGIQKEWINFEEIPEKRKPPKRIQTIPSRGNIEVPETLVQSHDNVIYTYVNPEECKCECHERPALRQPPPPPAPPPKYQQAHDQRSDLTHCHPGQDDPEEDLREDEMPLLEDDDDERILERDRGRDTLKPDRHSVISDSSVDLSTASQSHQPSHGHAPEETANGTSRTGTCSGMLQTPFTSDLGVSGGSNRSSIISQDEQISRSPD